MMMGSRNTHLIGWLQHCWGILVESGRFSIIRKQSSKHCPADHAVTLVLGHFISERAGGVQSMQLSLSLGSCLLTGPAREIRWWTRWWINFGADPWPGQLMGPDCGSHGADNRDRCWPDWHGCQPDVDGSTIEGLLTDADQTWEDMGSAKLMDRMAFGSYWFWSFR